MCTHRHVYYLADSWLKNKNKKIKRSLVMGRKSTDIKDSINYWSKKEKKEHKKLTKKNKPQTKNLQTSSL